MIVSVYGIGTADGLNGKGLAAHALYLKSTELPERDPAKPALQIALWAQYLLDNAAIWRTSAGSSSFTTVPSSG
jgi:choloylglycine hydrolase